MMSPDVKSPPVVARSSLTESARFAGFESDSLQRRAGRDRRSGNSPDVLPGSFVTPWFTARVQQIRRGPGCLPRA